MSARHVLALVLVFAGVGVVVLASTGALLAPALQPRLHFVTPVTSLGAPLICAGLAVENGFTLTTASFALILALLLVSNPVLTSAVGRLGAQHEGGIPLDEPE
jgi:multicomponent Na+:H+ antiporter subunit G